MYQNKSYQSIIFSLKLVFFCFEDFIAGLHQRQKSMRWMKIPGKNKGSFHIAELASVISLQREKSAFNRLGSPEREPDR